MALKIIHTADWHLGQSFFGYDRQPEHTAFLKWLAETVADRQIDVLLIAGDVFDVANPSASAQRQFYHFLKEINLANPGLQVVVVAGNHDSAERLGFAGRLLAAGGVHCFGPCAGRAETVALGGVVCPRCGALEGGLRPLSLPALRYLRHVQRSNYSEAQRVRLAVPAARAELEQTMQAYLTYQLERGLNSPDFLREIQRKGSDRAD